MEKINAFLESENPVTEQMGKLEAKAGIKKIHQFYGEICYSVNFHPGNSNVLFVHLVCDAFFSLSLRVGCIF